MNIPSLDQFHAFKSGRGVWILMACLSNGDTGFWGTPLHVSSVGWWYQNVGLQRRFDGGFPLYSAPTSPTSQSYAIANTGVLKYFLEKPNLMIVNNPILAACSPSSKAWGANSQSSPVPGKSGARK
jgi:hypothetical protein